MSQPIFVGIDVAKDTVEVACSDASSQSFTNNEAGHAKVLRWLARKRVALLVLEATGGYEQACAVAHARAKPSIEAVIELLLKQLADIDDDLKRTLKDRHADLSALLQSVKGVGP